MQSLQLVIEVSLTFALHSHSRLTLSPAGLPQRSPTRPTREGAAGHLRQHRRHRAIQHCACAGPHAQWRLTLCPQVFLSELEERQRQSRMYINTIGDLLKEHMKGLGSHYRGYCVNQSNAARTLKDLKRSDSSLRSLLEVRLPVVRRSKLSTHPNSRLRPGPSRQEPRARTLPARADAARHSLSPSHQSGMRMHSLGQARR